MKKMFRKFVTGLITACLALTGVVAAEQPSLALNASTFDPGWIISDSVFYDWGTMNADQIQKFLNARVATCTDNDGGPKCLKNYREDVVGSYAIRNTLHSYSLHICADVPAADNQTSAQIIAKVAVACRINPRVLLVTLQKEQGLVTAADPTTYMYKAAMGYGCPDSAPQICGQDSNARSRLFWQLYRAAWQLRWYGDPRGSFTYLKPGTNINMGYNPNASCGKKRFKLKSQATANLYYYTPYTPNAAALNNLWGTGDSCSAYGNRNFWRQFWTWFGSPVAGGYLLKSSSSETFLVNQSTSKKYKVPNDAMTADFEPLGPLGTVSDAYMDSFADAGELKNLVADESGKRYLISSGLKYPVANAAQATALGQTWDNAPVLTDVQISNFGDLAFGKSATTDEVFLLQGTTRALVSDPELLKSLSSIGSTAVMQESVLNGFTIVAPVNQLVQDSSGNRFDLEDGKKIPVANAGIAQSLGHNWNSATTIATAQLSKVSTASFIKGTGTTSTYFLSAGTKHLANAAMLSSMSKFGSTATVTLDYLSRFPTGGALTSLLKSDTQNWYISNGQKFLVNAAQLTAMNLSASTAVLATAAQLDTLPAPILMKSSTTGTTYLVDDYLTKHPLTTSDLATYSPLGAVGVVPVEYLNNFTVKSNPGRLVNSSDGYHYYLHPNRNRYRISNLDTAKAISPSSFVSGNDYASLPTLTSTQLAVYTLGSSSKYVTRYTTGTSGNFLIENGKLRQVLDTASLTAELGSTPLASVIGAASFSSYPLAEPVVANNSLFKNSNTGTYGIVFGNTYYQMNGDLAKEALTSSAWQFTKSAGTLSTASIAKITKGAEIGSFVTNGTNGYLLTGAGKQALTDVANLVATPALLPAALLEKVGAVAGDALATPFIVKASNTATTSYLVTAKTKRTVFDSDEGNKLLPLMSVSIPKVWPQYVIDQISAGSPVLAPATIVKVKESNNIYLVDGWGKGLRINAATAKVFGVTKPKLVTRADLTAYNTTGILDWQKFTCAGATYVMDKGIGLLLDSATQAQWPGTAKALDAKTCQRLTLGTVRLGVFAMVAGKYYKAIDGKLKPIRTTAEYNTMSRNLTPAAEVSPDFVDSMAKLNPTSYVVVAGDSLYKVAVKFKTTRATLRSLNNLSTDVLQRGQILVLP